MPQTCSLPSGAQLVLNIADYESSDRLFRAVLSELKTSKLDLSGIDTDNIMESDISAVLQGGFALLSSREIMEAIWACAIRCLYNSEKITRKAFEAEEARQDVYPMAWEVAKINLSPFFGSLASLLKKQAAVKAPVSPV